jgi:Cytochrome P460
MALCRFRMARSLPHCIWNEDSSDADNQALAAGFPGLGLESTFAGSAVNVQFMVKDSKKYVASGGWGFADFTHGKPGNEATHRRPELKHPNSWGINFFDAARMTAVDAAKESAQARRLLIPLTGPFHRVFWG